MFKDEAKIAINLSHNNIVSIFEFGVELGQFFLVMDYVKGKNVRQILNKLKQANMNFGVDQIVFMCKEIAAGLDHAHRCIDGATGKPLNITHRDMSPQNVMVSFEGELKIIDFGIAKSETQLETTRAGTLKGKFGYMSPEQAEGLNVDLRTDIFSLGIVLWELLANDRLFIANNEINTLRKIRDCQIPSLTKINPEVHPELERIVLKALTKDRNQRYQTAAALHRDLSRFLNRHYPDFSNQDFSMFIKSLYADEILEFNNKQVEYSQVVFEDVPSSDFHPGGDIPKKEQTLTDTHNPPIKPQPINLNLKNLGLGPAKSNTQNEASDHPADPFTSRPSNEGGINSNGFNRNQVQQTNLKNEELGEEPNDFSKGYNTFENAPSNHTITHTGGHKGLAPGLIKQKKPFNPAVIGHFAVVAFAIYLVLSTVIPQSMRPLNLIVSKGLADVGVCGVLLDSGFTNVMDNIGLSSEALCIKAIDLASTNSNGDDTNSDARSRRNPLRSISININSDPSGAQIIIDDVHDNLTTPALIPFTPGKKVKLELVKKDFKVVRIEQFDPSTLSTRAFKAKLEKVSYGYINVDAKPPQFSDKFSEIYINGQKINQPLPIIRYPVPANQETTVELVNPMTNKKTIRKVYLDSEQNKSVVFYLKRTPAGSTSE
jgi:serine/threonine protein kinase